MDFVVAGCKTSSVFEFVERLLDSIGIAFLELREPPPTGTYTAQPEHGHDDMTIGLEDWQDDRPRRFGWAMLLPFK